MYTFEKTGKLAVFRYLIDKFERALTSKKAEVGAN